MRLLSFCAALIVIVGSVAAQSSSPAPSAQELRVVYSRVIRPPLFVSDMPIRSNIFTVDTGLRVENQITDDNKSFSPMLSPNGVRIAFISLDPETCEGCLIPARHNLAVMNVDGSNLRVLQPLSSNFQLVKWSPDGKFLLFLKRVQAVGSNGESSAEFHLFLISVD